MKWIGLLCMLFQTLVMAEEMIPVVVIGSGPAGLSAALVTGRDRIETHVFLGKRPGGPLNAITCMGNWPGSVKGKGHVVMNRVFEQLKRFDVQLHDQAIDQVDFSKMPFRLVADDGRVLFAKTVIIATGAHPKKLMIKGEEEYWEKGIETLVYKPNAPRFAGKTVAVIGGGIDATKKAAIASKTADKVYVIVRGKSMQKPFMEKRLQKKDNIEILTQSEITQILGSATELTHIDLKTPSGYKRLKMDSLILALGVVPDTALVCDQIDVDEQGYIVLQERSQSTSIPGIFAAGNATDPRYRQAAISSGDGMKAGYDALEFLNQIVDLFPQD